MESLISKLPELVMYVTSVLGGLVVIATGLAQVSSSKSFKAKAGSVSTALEKIIEVLPTLGTNPKTKELKKELAEAKGIDVADLK